MTKVTIEIEDLKSDIWKNLPPVCQYFLTNKALNAILNGTPYPTGANQLELAIELAENGVIPDVISKVSGLDRTIFEAFL
ncbi:MAG: hypothetical protein K2Q22_01280 [Cytophagales bacterium]|nr:hypothetical protein [Cytophagales bacterium]